MSHHPSIAQENNRDSIDDRELEKIHGLLLTIMARAIMIGAKAVLFMEKAAMAGFTLNTSRDMEVQESTSELLQKIHQQTPTAWNHQWRKIVSGTEDASSKLISGLINKDQPKKNVQDKPLFQVAKNTEDLIDIPSVSIITQSQTTPRVLVIISS